MQGRERWAEPVVRGGPAGTPQLRALWSPAARCLWLCCWSPAALGPLWALSGTEMPLEVRSPAEPRAVAGAVLQGAAVWGCGEDAAPRR